MLNWRPTLAFLLTVAFIVRGAASPPVPTPDNPSSLHYKAVLAAGDWSSPAFDHATEAVRDWLLARQVASDDIQRLSASRAVIAHDGLRPASLDHVLSAIEHLHPAPGQACFVFATSHGAYQDGLVLVPSENFLTPAALNTALNDGCGNAPTVVIISGCFSGSFTKAPMARENRIVLTAAREDRPSFGCGTGSRYTFYDRCFLRAIDRSANWRAAYDTIRACVSARENALHFQPSEPQAWFGEAVRDLPLSGLPS
ncbi:MAG: C13 family peptidase [Acetobacteraceae bacterium]|jgi:hypothetical protein